jgi:hypothetical protein
LREESRYDLFGGLVARVYRRSLEDQGFEVLMMTVFDIAAHRGYTVARSVVLRELGRRQLDSVARGCTS